MTVRIIVQIVSTVHGAHVQGAPAEVEYRTFDIQHEALERCLFYDQDSHFYGQVLGVEVLSDAEPGRTE